MLQIRMEVSKLLLLVVLIVPFQFGCCHSLEESVSTTEEEDAVNNLIPLPEASATGQFQDAAEETGAKGKFEGGISSKPEDLFDKLEEKSSLDRDTSAVSANSEGSISESDTKSLHDGAEADRSIDTKHASETAQTSSEIVLEAFGPTDKTSEDEETKESQSDVKEEEVWTEQTEEGTEQKRTGRRFFSLMNLIKFLLNPVIEEFQEVEKSSNSHDAPGSASTTTIATDGSNKSEIANVSSGNSSEVGDKDEKKNGTESGKKTKFQCVGRNVTENTTATVRIVNSTVLLEVLSFDKNHSTSDCVLVMFYAPWCHFCATTAPHYNAIARAFPQLEVLAVDTVHFSNLNARFGTVAVPNIMLFHQSRSAVRFNHTERHFHTLLQFITNTTGLEANTSVELSAGDYEGPLSSTPSEETDYLLWFAWIFIIVCSGHIFISSQVGQRAIDRVIVLWQEHQHQHIE